MSAKLNHISITEIKRLINEETELLCMYNEEEYHQIHIVKICPFAHKTYTTNTNNSKTKKR